MTDGALDVTRAAAGHDRVARELGICFLRERKSEIARAHPLRERVHMNLDDRFDTSEVESLKLT